MAPAGKLSANISNNFNRLRFCGGHAPRDVMKDQASKARDEAGGLPLYYTEWNISSNPREIHCMMSRLQLSSPDSASLRLAVEPRDDRAVNQRAGGQRTRFATWEEFNAHLFLQCQKRRERKLRGHQPDHRRAFRERPGAAAALVGSTVRSLRQAVHAGDVDGTGALSVKPSLASTTTGCRHPYSRIEAATFSTACVLHLRAFLG